MLFKELDNKSVHYSVFIRGSLIDFHKTIEEQRKHIPIVEIELNWQLLMGRIIQEVWANWKSIFQSIRTDDPDWADLEVDFIPIQVLMELLSPLMKGTRWNVDAHFLQRLEASVSHVRYVHTTIEQRVCVKRARFRPKKHYLGCCEWGSKI